MKFFDIDDFTKIKLDDIEAIKMVKTIEGYDIDVVISGVQYRIEKSRQPIFVKEWDVFQRGIDLTKQYYAI